MPKDKKYWNVKKVTGDNRSVDVLIYGYIGSDFDWWTGEENGNPADEFVLDFKSLESQYDRINIRINSPGGSIWDGLPMFNVISQSKKEVHTYCDGIAYSMAAIILLAGKHVHAAKNSLILLHSPLTVAIGNAKDMRDTAVELDKYANSLITSVTSKTGLTEKEAKSKYFDYNDHLMTASEALDAKLIDDIIDEEVKLPEGISNMTFKQVINLYREQKDQNGFISTLANHMKQFFNISLRQKTEEDIIMNNLEKFVTALKLNADASVDDVLNAVTALNKKATDLEAEKNTIQASLTEKTDSLVAAESQLTAEVAAHAITKKEFSDFKALDAGDESRTGKVKDKIEGADPEIANFAHNQVADEFSGK
jgi:ATP-dependent Clp endopeptidase proteolytic subunit ClpP